jgi:hypothetical protein
MYIKLPINKNNKIVNELFRLYIKDNIIYLIAMEKDNYKKVICYNNYLGYYDIDIYFPIEFNIYNNIIYNEYFFIFSVVYEKIYNNSVYIIEQNIQKINKDYRFIKYKELDDLKIISEKLKYTSIEFNNLESLLYNNFKYIQYIFNISLCYIYNNIYKINVKNNIIDIINNIYDINILYYGIYDKVKNHINYIKKKNKIKNNDYYFISYNDKLLKIFIQEYNKNYIITKNKKIDITKYNVSKYPQKFIENINYKNLILEIIKTIDYNIFEKYINSDKLNITNYYNNKNIEHIYITNYNFNDEIFLKLSNNYNYCYNIYSFEYFKKKVDNLEYDEQILNILFSEYNFPFNYDNRNININFKKIIYYIYNNYEKIKNININSKIKFIYNQLLKLIYEVKHKNISILNNYKIYVDYIFINIFNSILIFNELNIDIEYKNRIYKHYFNNLKAIYIINNLSWYNLNVKLREYKFILQLKNENNKLLFYENKINNNIIEFNIDNRIKKIIIEPINMYVYLSKERDFIKWTYILDNNINLFYENNIKINKTELKYLGKILYLLFNIKNQNLDDIEYTKTIKYMKKHENLVLFNDRINLKIRDIIKHNNINMGFLAKHIISEQFDTIDLNNSSDEIENLNNKLEKITNRYHKYKGKYLNYKLSELSTNKNI